MSFTNEGKSFPTTAQPYPSFKATKFFDDYISGRDDEAYERYQDSCPQYAPDGSLVRGGRDPHEIARSRHVRKRPASSSTTSTTRSPSRLSRFSSGVTAIGHPEFARAAAKAHRGKRSTESHMHKVHKQ
jgi:hypothetical protein